MNRRHFSLGAVLSAYTGRMCVSDIGQIYGILNFMLDDDLFTHQLPAASSAVIPSLERQFPWLTEVELPEGGGEDFTDAVRALADEHGVILVVEKADNAEWKTGNAMKDLLDIAGDKPIIVLDVGEDND